MRYNVAQLLKSPIGATRQYEVDEDVSGFDARLVPTQRLRGEVTFLRLDHGVLITGRVQTFVQIACGRCLETIESDLRVDLEETFHPTLDVMTGRRLPMEEEDQALWIDEHHIIDLQEVIRQNLVLALPTHPVCRDDCAGICPQCGRNRNEGPCSCRQGEVDHRWAALLGWKPE